MRTGGLVLLLLLNVAAAVGAQGQSAEHEPVVDTYFGTQVADTHRWLEDLEDPRVQAWFREQGEAARAALDALPGRADFLSRIQEVVAASPDAVSLPQEAGGRFFYTRRGADDPVSRLYVREGWTGEERLLVDPADFSGAGETGASRLTGFTPTADGERVAVAIAAGGSENSVLRVVDVATRRDLGVAIQRNRWGVIEWLPGGKHLLYLQLRDLPPDAPPAEGFRSIRLVRHRTGTDPSEDAIVFSADRVGAESRLIPWMQLDPAEGVVFASLTSGVERYSAYYAAPTAAVADGEPSWRPLFTLEDRVQEVALHGDDLYVVTFRDAPTGRVVRTRLSEPDLASSEPVFAGGSGVIQQMAEALDGLYVLVFEEGRNYLVRIPWGGAPKAVRLPPEASVSQIWAHPLRSGLLFWLESWVEAGRAYRYAPSADEIVELALREVGRFDRLDGFVAEVVKVPSHDGVEVPLTILRPESFVRNGSHPVLLRGYGAYGSTYEPSYDVDQRPWFEAGGVVAMCHVRGGGYYGEAWHLAGQKATKPNSWKDLIACGEFLVREGYTRTDRLTVHGVSAGGILVGRAVTARPDLFGSAVIQVGLADMVRSELTLNGAPNVAEFGSVKTEEGFRALLEMSPYHHVRPGTAYPATLLSTGMNDERVDSWHPAKLAAALQEATTSGEPVWLRVDYEAGHGAAATQQKSHEFQADLYAFAFAQAGVAPLLDPEEPGLQSSDDLSAARPRTRSTSSSSGIAPRSSSVRRRTETVPCSSSRAPTISM